MSRTRMRDHHSYDYASHPYLSMRKAGESYSYSLGVFWSPHGIVDVYRQPPFCGCPGITSIRFIRHGRVYNRSWQTDWPDRTIARLAREFADEVAGA